MLVDSSRRCINVIFVQWIAVHIARDPCDTNHNNNIILITKADFDANRTKPGRQKKSELQWFIVPLQQF